MQLLKKTLTKWSLLKTSYSAIYDSAVIYPSNLLFSLKVAYFSTVSTDFSVNKQNSTGQ